ncbi:MAG: riboflavin synthase subunit alpha [Candidatus Omnitrophica bacterium CG1_02_40_15]|nr:MAG: riboflavin synthase subunit alpha [Candidatus Omnitrophica bacterium CG1_02_40_15]
MFTGIIEEIGIVKEINKTSTGVLLKIKTEKVYSDAKIGDSICVNGSCLSVVEISGNILSFDVIPETLKRTALAHLKINYSVNMERSIKADSRIGGHFLTGHVDYKGSILDISRKSEGVGFKLPLPKEYSNFVVEKGSVGLDGVSLTVASVTKEYFTVYLIPHTLKSTTFSTKKKGDFINIETDIIGKYVAKDKAKASDFKDILREYGYM